MTDSPSPNPAEVLVLLIEHDGDGSPSVALARNRAELLEQVKVAVWGEPNPADTTNDAGDDMAEAMTDILLETGVMRFEGDPPLQLVRIPVEGWFPTAPLCDERSSEGSARALQLSDIDAAAKVYASSYASPHHITFTVAGLRNLIASLASPSPQLSSLSGWVSVKDRLPKPWAEVLLALSNGQVTTGEFCGPELGAFNWHETDEDTPETCVTHWMPLPPPPQS